MDDTLVSSRLSKAKKEAGIAVLDSLGFTISDLINQSFDYLIATKQMPSLKSEQNVQASDFEKYVSESTLDIDWSGEARSYKEILRSERVSDYESLA